MAAPTSSPSMPSQISTKPSSKDQLDDASVGVVTGAFVVALLGIMIVWFFIHRAVGEWRKWQTNWQTNWRRAQSPGDGSRTSQVSQVLAVF